MAINIPPDQSGTHKSKPASEGNQKPAPEATTGNTSTAPAKTEATGEPDTRPKTASSIIKAVVTEVQAKQASGHYTKALYQATVQLNPDNKQLSSPQASQSQVVKEQIDAALSRQIQAGRSVAIRVETPAPVKVGQLLDVQLSGDGLKLVKIAPPPIAMTTQPLIRQQLNLQNSYVHLLAKVIAVIQSLKSELPGQSAAPSVPQSTRNNASGLVPSPGSPPAPLPKQSSGQAPVTNTNTTTNQPRNQPAAKRGNLPGADPSAHATRPLKLPALTLQQNTAKQLEQIVQQFLQSLPTKSETSDAKGLKDAVRNSGIFYESRIVQPDRFNPGQAISKASQTADKTLQTTPTAESPAVPENARPVTKASAASKQAELIQQIRRHIKTLKTTLQESTPSAKGNSTAETINTSVNRDLKYNLLQLENQLKKLQSDIQSTKVTDRNPATTTADAAKVKQPASVDRTAVKLPDGKTAEPGAKPLDAKTPDVKPLDKVILEQARIKTGKGSVPTTESNQQRGDREATSPVYQRPRPGIGTTTASVYQEENDNPTKPKVPGLDWAHPPLPGKIQVQPQTIRPNLAPNESLVDALLSVLIKHTKEATSRLNLHQLASLTDMARPETAAQQTMLSFELPILQGLDLSLFQFRIYDEETGRGNDDSDDKKQKKWVVHMGFDLEGLGPMYCQIALIGMSASVTFWAEEKYTVERSRAHLDELRDNLNKLGVNVKEMQCIKGSPPHDESGIKQTLIDIET